MCKFGEIELGPSGEIYADSVSAGSAGDGFYASLIEVDLS